MKRSSCASGSSKVPDCSTGFCVAMTRKGTGRRQVLSADGHLALLHGLEHRALHFRRGAVDLIGQQQIGEDRAAVDAELAALLIDDLRADDVGGQHVDGELDALEVEVDGLGDGVDQQRLREAGQPLQQQVAAGEERDHDALDDDILADDDLGDTFADAGDELLRGLRRALRGAGQVVCMMDMGRMGRVIRWQRRSHFEAMPRRSASDMALAPAPKQACSTRLRSLWRSCLLRFLELDQGAGAEPAQQGDDGKAIHIVPAYGRHRAPAVGRSPRPPCGASAKQRAPRQTGR